MRYDLKLKSSSSGRGSERASRMLQDRAATPFMAISAKGRICLRSVQFCANNTPYSSLIRIIIRTQDIFPCLLVINRDPVMRGRLASIAAAITVLLLLIFFFASVPTSWTLRQPSGPVLGQGLYTGWPDPVPWNPPKPQDPSEANPAGRLIVKVKLKEEDTSDIESLASLWQSNVIVIESQFSHTHPKAHRPDKGRVANAYLTWIVENYHNLPETLLFIPPKDSLENPPLDLHTVATTLQIPFIEASGFANLRCPSQKSRTTCNDHVLEPFHPTHEFRTLETNITQAWASLFGKAVEVPQQIATVLGAEFAVSKVQVQRRSVEDYLKCWAWLNRTIMDDDSAGLVIEYVWHVVFGKEAIFCPERVRCECELYGKCEA
jgi:hypothetical protein